MPTAMHFLSLQYWQRLRLIRSMLHCWFFVHGLYCIFCCMLRLKKPWWQEKSISSVEVLPPPEHSLSEDELEEEQVHRRRGLLLVVGPALRLPAAASSHSLVHPMGFGLSARKFSSSLAPPHSVF